MRFNVFATCPTGFYQNHVQMSLNRLLSKNDHPDMAEERRKARFDTDEMAAIIWDSKKVCSLSSNGKNTINFSESFQRVRSTFVTLLCTGVLSPISPSCSSCIHVIPQRLSHFPDSFIQASLSNALPSIHRGPYKV